MRFLMSAGSADDFVTMSAFGQLCADQIGLATLSAGVYFVHRGLQLSGR